MTFASPVMLWSLLALLPLVAVYLLKVRPRRRPTTAYFLWEKIFHERRSNRLWHRLRSLVSLLIMAAAFALIALAMAEPRWSDVERADLLILIDNSASMSAKGHGGERLELAKEEARDLARALDGVQRAAVATVADRLRYQSHLTDNPRELLAAIDKIGPTNEEFRESALGINNEDVERPMDASEDNPEEASQDESEGEEPSRRRVLLITDGVLDGDESPAGVELILVGEDAPNLGIVAADLQFVPGTADQMTFYYQVASTGDEPLEVDLLLSREDEAGLPRLAKVIPLTVAPGVNAPQTLTVEGAAPGRWLAELDGAALAGDALAADNTAYLVARRPPPIAMAVASDDPYFFEQSVQAFSAGASSLRLVSEGEEVTLAKGVGAASRVIVFQPAGESPWWSELGEEFEVGAVKVNLEDHPIVRHVDPYSLRFIGARRIQAPQGSRVLVESDDGTPLLYEANRAGEAAVVVNLDPVASEFYFSAWFPVLVHSAATRLAGREQTLLATYQPGDAIELPSTDDRFEAELTPPTGAATQLTEPRVPRIAELGFYSVNAAGRQESVSASLLSKQESMLSTDRDAPPPVALASGGPPGGWFVVLALIAATAESVLYHRRKVG